MSYHYYLMLINGLALTYTSVVGIARYRAIDKAMRIFIVFTIACLVVELVAYYTALRWQNNMAVYGVGAVLQMALTALYFNEAIAVLKKYHIGIALAILSIGFGFYDLGWLEPLGTDNSIYMLFQAFTTIVLSLVALRQNLLGPVRQPHHSQIAMVLLLFWTFSFLIGGLYKELTDALGPRKGIVDFLLFAFNIAANSCIAFIFSKYLKRLRYDT